MSVSFFFSVDEFLSASCYSVSCLSVSCRVTFQKLFLVFSHNIELVHIIRIKE